MREPKYVGLRMIWIFNQGDVGILKSLKRICRLALDIRGCPAPSVETPQFKVQPYNRYVFQQYSINWGGSSVVEREIAIRILQFLKHLEVPCSIHGRPFLFVHLKNSPASFFGAGRKNAE